MSLVGEVVASLLVDRIVARGHERDVRTKGRGAREDGNEAVFEGSPVPGRLPFEGERGGLAPAISKRGVETIGAGVGETGSRVAPDIEDHAIEQSFVLRQR